MGRSRRCGKRPGLAATKPGSPSNRVTLEQRGESRGPWMTVVVMQRICWDWPGWRWSVPLPRLGEDRTAGHRGSGAARCRAVADIDVVERVDVYPARIWPALVNRWCCCGASTAGPAEPQVVLYRRSPSKGGAVTGRDAVDHAIARAVTDGRGRSCVWGVLADGAGGAGCLCAGRTRRARADLVLGLD